MTHLTNSNNWIVAITTLIVVSLCIGLHYEVLSNCSRYLPIVSHQRRRRVIFLILIILVTHVIEMWFFTLGYYFLVQFDTLGTLSSTAIVGAGGDIVSLLDYAYYSAMVYTTVGVGVSVPS